MELDEKMVQEIIRKWFEAAAEEKGIEGVCKIYALLISEAGTQLTRYCDQYEKKAEWII